jgi:hypothetical protein
LWLKNGLFARWRSCRKWPICEIQKNLQDLCISGG